MGTTRTETGLSELRNHTTVSLKNNLVYYPALVFVGVIGFVFGSNAYTQSTIDNTLRLCNQKPLECKFKYDILMYEQTGKVPYSQSKMVENSKK